MFHGLALLEGGESGRSTDWWDRSVGTDMSFSERTFSQEFVQAEGRKIEEPIDPESSYWVLCTGQFSGGWSMTDTAPVNRLPVSVSVMVALVAEVTSM